MANGYQWIISGEAFFTWLRIPEKYILMMASHFIDRMTQWSGHTFTNACQHCGQSIMNASSRSDVVSFFFFVWIEMEIEEWKNNELSAEQCFLGAHLKLNTAHLRHFSAIRINETCSCLDEASVHFSFFSVMF